MDKSHAQAQETRQRNAEARKAAREAIAAERKQDEALVLEALRAVLQDPAATSAQRLYAVAVLDNMKLHGFVPYDLKCRDIVSAFVKELEREK